MILVDTSVWVDHLRSGDARLGILLDAGQVLGHPWVTGEIALGRPRDPETVLRLLRQLPQGPVAADDELLGFVDRHRLAGTGVGYVDAQLLASTMLASDAVLWSRDRRLQTAADRLGVADPGEPG